MDQKQRRLVQVSKGEALGVSYSSDPYHGTLLLLSWPLYRFTLDPSCLLRLRTVGQGFLPIAFCSAQHVPSLMSTVAAVLGWKYKGILVIRFSTDML